MDSEHHDLRNHSLECVVDSARDRNAESSRSVDEIIVDIEQKAGKFAVFGAQPLNVGGGESTDEFFVIIDYSDGRDIVINQCLVSFDDSRLDVQRQRVWNCN